MDGLGRFDHEAGGLQVTHDGGHRGGRQGGPAREVGARNGTGLGQNPDDASPRVAA